MNLFEINIIGAAFPAIRSRFFVFVISTVAQRNGEISNTHHIEISPLRSVKNLTSVEMTNEQKQKRLLAAIRAAIGNK